MIRMEKPGLDYIFPCFKHEKDYHKFGMMKIYIPNETASLWKYAFITDHDVCKILLDISRVTEIYIQTSDSSGLSSSSRWKLNLRTLPSTHTTLFWRPYDVVLILWMLYGRQSDVVCLLGRNRNIWCFAN